MDIFLEPLCEKHLEETYLWMQDEKLRKDFMLPFLVTKEGHKEWYKRYLADASQKIWAIYCEERYVGNVGLKNIDTKNRKAEGWMYVGNSSLHGKHIGSETWGVLFRNGDFESLGLHKLYSFVAERNMASRKMLLNAGFQEEGILKDEVYFGEEYVSLYRFGILF